MQIPSNAVRACCCFGATAVAPAKAPEAHRRGPAATQLDPDRSLAASGRAPLGPATSAVAATTAIRGDRASTTPFRARLRRDAAITSVDPRGLRQRTAIGPRRTDAAGGLGGSESVVRWVASRRQRAPAFLLIDKVNATVFAFDRAGRFQGAAPALLGMARGDRLLAPNDAKMAQMPPSVRITPAGRFVSRLALDSHGKELLVLDYEASISLHPVVKGTPEEHRAERLNSATSQDNRISFGCINVPPGFYSTIVSPSFTGTKGIVYVLPETGTARELFGMNPVGAVLTGTQAGPAAVGAPASPKVPAPDASSPPRRPARSKPAARGARLQAHPHHRGDPDPKKRSPACAGLRVIAMELRSAAERLRLCGRRRDRATVRTDGSPAASPGTCRRSC
jgi:hypothetical protein